MIRKAEKSNNSVLLEMAGKQKDFPPAVSSVLHSDMSGLFDCSVYIECTWTGVSQNLIAQPKAARWCTG